MFDICLLLPTHIQGFLTRLQKEKNTDKIMLLMALLTSYTLIVLFDNYPLEVID